MLVECAPGVTAEDITARTAAPLLPAAGPDTPQGFPRECPVPHRALTSRQAAV